MTDFQPGDKIRISYEVVVDNAGHYTGITLGGGAVNNYTVEVIEKAEDPVGTVRASDGIDRGLWIKITKSTWIFTDGFSFMIDDYTDSMFSDPIIGRVPGMETI